MGNNKYIAYYRVSTREQGISGLGIESQRYSIENFIKKKDIVKEFVEIESGRKKNRPKLEEAINLCKEKGYSLIVAKLDRLGRIVSHLFAIRDNINLIVVEKPNMSTLEFAIYSGMAQDEAEKISARTKAALDAKKRQGFKLGTPENLTDQARQKGYDMRKEKAKENENNIRAIEVARDLRKEQMSYSKIAERLNKYGMKSATGKKFYPATVRNLLNLYNVN